EEDPSTHNHNSHRILLADLPISVVSIVDDSHRSASERGLRMRRLTTACGLLLLATAALAHGADEAAFDGEWRTSFGIVKLKQAGSAVTGTYGNAGQFTLKGMVKGKKLTFEYQEGQANGEANWTMDDSGHSFRGEFKIRGGQAGVWQGWRP